MFTLAPYTGWAANPFHRHCPRRFLANPSAGTPSAISNNGLGDGTEAEEEKIGVPHLSEAIGYRRFDRNENR